MKAIVVTDEAAGTAGMTLVERPEPNAAVNDVVVQVHASGFTPGELTWPSTWTDRLGRDRTPSIPGHELAGVVSALGYGTTGLSVGQRVFGLTDWYRDGTLAEYVAVEARNLAPLPGDVDFTVGASLPISGLTAWQGLFEHGRLQAGQSVLVHGAAGAVGSMVTQLAREVGAYVIGTGRAADRQTALDFGAQEFVDLENDALEDVGGVDLVFDVIGGDIGKRSAALVRAGGTLVTIAGPPEARPADGLAVDFVVEADRAQLGEIVQRVRDGRLRTNIGNVATLDDAVAAFNPTERIRGRRSSAFVRERHDAIVSMHQRDSMTEETIPMKAIVVTDQAAGTAGMTLVERPEPPAQRSNDVVVEVHASGFVPTEMAWPSTWTDRRDRDRTPSIPGHELAGVVTALGYGTTGLSVGQRVFGLTDWHRDGTLAEYVAVEARNLAPLPGDVDFTVGASLPISGLTAWQGLFEHGRLQAGQSVLAHGAAGAVGSMVTQLAREAGAYVIGTGRAADRQTALDFGAQEFVDLDNDALEDVGGVDLVFDVIGGDIQKRSAGLIRAGGTLVTVVGPPEARPADGLAIDFVVESDRAQLSEIVQRVRDGRLRTNIGNVATLDDAVAAFNPTERRKGKTIIRVRP